MNRSISIGLKQMKVLLLLTRIQFMTQVTELGDPERWSRNILDFKYAVFIFIGLFH